MEDIVSIVVIAWNLLYQTKDCLEAINRNVDYPFEVIVVNNNSTDDTYRYLLESAPRLFTNKLFRNLKVVNNSENKYLSGGINIGVSKSVGKYISIVANDIVIPENMYNFMIDKLNEDKDIGAIGPWFTEDQNALKLAPDRLDSILYYLELINDKETKIDDNWHFSVCHIMRRDVWDKVGKWDENLRTHCNDNDWGIRLELCGYKAVTYHKYVCYHHYGSFGRKQIPQESEVAKSDLNYFVRKWGKRPDDKQPISVISDEIKNIAKMGNYNVLN